MVKRRTRIGGSLSSVLKKAHSFIKQRKVVSGLLSHFGHTKLSAGARALGYGRRRVVRRRAPVRRRTTVRRRAPVRKRRGGSLSSVLQKAHSFIKQRKVVSGLLTHFGHNKLASSARALGYGRRRAPRRRGTVRRHRGGGFFGDVWNGIKSAANYVKDNHIISRALQLMPNQAPSMIASHLGLGRRRHRGGSMQMVRPTHFTFDQPAMTKY